MEAYAWALGACRVSLNVLPANTPAQDLYRARGWVQDREFFLCLSPRRPSFSRSRGRRSSPSSAIRLPMAVAPPRR
ncbi:hypothetical protein [Aquabacterium sp.]|uniref:hypothetical protein n=1 Tax=Aquabacterium sp. TaxID=1872578 RepID=UPI003784F05D